MLKRRKAALKRGNERKAEEHCTAKQPVALKRGEKRNAEHCAVEQPVLKRRRAALKRGKKRKAAEGCAIEDKIRLVGDARETESEHRARHPAGKGWEKVCPRCDYYLNRAVWEQHARTQGASDRPRVGGETSWLAPTPPFLGGAWG